MKDYYKILKVNKNASSQEIKKAYRMLSLQYHPDKNSSSNSKDLFISINEAYKILIDPNQRNIYNSILNHSPLTSNPVESDKKFEEQKTKFNYHVNSIKIELDLEFDKLVERGLVNIFSTIHKFRWLIWIAIGLLIWRLSR